MNSRPDIMAHVLQLCHYVEDLQIEPELLKLADYDVLRRKAEQVKQMVNEHELVKTYSPL